MYALELAEAQSKSENVILLTPGAISFRKSQRGQVAVQPAKKWRGIPHFQIKNPLPIPMANGINNIDWYTMSCQEMVYESFLQKISPEIIHVHSLMGIHAEFLQAAKKQGIPIVFTTHDYFGLCLKPDMMYKNKICDCPGRHCAECSYYALHDKALLIEQTQVYRLYRKTHFMSKIFCSRMLNMFLKELRGKNPQQMEEQEAVTGERIIDAIDSFPKYQFLLNYYRNMLQNISYFHFNSSVARDIYEENLGQLKGDIIPVFRKNVCDRRKYFIGGDKLKMIFLGGDSPYKGLRELQAALNILYEQKEMHAMELHVYGSMEKKPYPFCRYHAAYQPEDMGRVFEQADVLMVPSRCPETFGMVVIEAFSYGVPSVVTEYVGAKDILGQKENACGMVIKDSQEALQEAIETIYHDRGILTAYRRNICNANCDLNYVNHVGKIKELYCKCRGQLASDAF